MEQNKKRFSDRLRADRTGAKGVSSTGEPVTVKEYRGAHDIDVLFPDGTIRHSTWWNFTRGKVSKSGYHSKKNDRIGQSFLQESGLTAECTDYEDCDHVTIRFKDGYEAKTTWKQFSDGHVFHPLEKRDHDRFRAAASHVGEMSIHKATGLKMECISYVDYLHITAKREDGETAETAMRAFKNGTVRFGKTSRQKKENRLSWERIYFPKRSCKDMQV